MTTPCRPAGLRPRETVVTPPAEGGSPPRKCENTGSGPGVFAFGTVLPCVPPRPRVTSPRGTESVHCQPVNCPSWARSPPNPRQTSFADHRRGGGFVHYDTA